VPSQAQSLSYVVMLMNVSCDPVSVLHEQDFHCSMLLNSMYIPPNLPERARLPGVCLDDREKRKAQLERFEYNHV
jgi:hypothetical protein